MPFDWREHDGEPLEGRFERGAERVPGMLGRRAWSVLIEAITPIEVQADSETNPRHDRLISHFQTFLGAIDAADVRDVSDGTPSSHPVVFVSHQRSDLAEAERIACLACRQGIDYWLDIHDPVLKLANQLIRPSDARYPFIIAAIIEMGLLNASCLIAVHTTNSQASKWVPYELGRVKSRKIKSANAGGWFHPNLLPRQCGDYVHLCRIAPGGGEHAVNGWLGTWASGGVARPWRGNPTAPLP